MRAQANKTFGLWILDFPSHKVEQECGWSRVVEALVVVVVVTSYYRTNLPTKINPKRFTEEKSAPLFKHSIGSNWTPSSYSRQELIV